MSDLKVIGTPKPSMAMIVRWDEGRRSFNLGTIRTGKIRGPLSRIDHRIRVAIYRWVRRADFRKAGL